MKRTAFALMFLPLISAGAFAAGYTGPGATPQVTTVAGALEAADDAQVVLEGQIVKRLGDERYEFRDATGTIQVEIDDEDWPGQSVSENTKVRLTGEVDKDVNQLEVDVDRVELIN
ncbi:YgiW/YdeI family stress tolerance OB fold protein [Pseudomonas sp. NCCP-436]|uniref:YgiW/YdeI family stress tolerance OB fold protein n=1 Tax=Pseudomonas sp. NCCP-436 TaxID=2842481 RepID=UPI001C8213B3|nr:NirD/YgiW/YdeI family stress tolerance protein [Pseudomonas sp. NCCP-436]